MVYWKGYFVHLSQHSSEPCALLLKRSITNEAIFDFAQIQKTVQLYFQIRVIVIKKAFDSMYVPPLIRKSYTIINLYNINITKYVYKKLSTPLPHSLQFNRFQSKRNTCIYAKNVHRGSTGINSRPFTLFST